MRRGLLGAFVTRKDDRVAVKAGPAAHSSSQASTGNGRSPARRGITHIW
jgi:hypothetical protein